MNEVKIVFKFIKNIVWGLIIEAILLIVAGVLIFIYPNLLGMLVGIFLIISGIVSLVLAIKANHYSKIKIDV